MPVGDLNMKHKYLKISLCAEKYHRKPTKMLCFVWKLPLLEKIESGEWSDEVMGELNNALADLKR